MAYGKMLAALAHPTRRRLLERLRQGPQTVGELARHIRISQPGASQHLRILRSAKLVTERKEGVRRYYRACPEGLEELRRYVESLWDDVLRAYAAVPDPVLKKKQRGKH